MLCAKYNLQSERTSETTCKRDQIKMRDYMNSRVTPPKQVTSSAWVPPPPCKQALKLESA